MKRTPLKRKTPLSAKKPSSVWTGKKKFLAGVTSLFGKQTKIGTFTQYHNLDVAREIQSQACSADVKAGQCVYVDDKNKVKPVVRKINVFGATLYARTFDGAIRKPLPRQKKSAIGKWEQTLDSLAHEIVVLRDPCCQKCGHEFKPSDSPLMRREVHHILGRGKTVRWITEAQAALCLLCHDYFTQNPNAAKRWAQSWLRVSLFDDLEAIARRPMPVTIGFLESTELRLRNQLKQLKELKR